MVTKSCHPNAMRGVLILFAFLGLAHAQNAAGVFGPKVNDGFRAFEYRFSSSGPSEGSATPWVQRAHWEQALNGRLQARLGVQWRDRSADTETEFQFLRAMLFVEAGQPTPGWTTGFRFDARVRNGSSPDELAAHWTNQFDLGPKTFARFNVMSFFEISENAPDGPVIETRSSLFRRLDGGHAVGLELYNNYGELGRFRTVDEQYHELAPVISWSLPGPYALYTSVGIGLSDGAPDSSIRLRLTRRF